jgi:hypothetical protein
MWGPGAQGGFQNALAMGMQMGQVARQNQQQNALMQQRQAQIDLQGRQFEAEQAAAAQTADLTAKALQGDDAALSQLATVNFDRWKSLDGQIKGKAAEDAQVLGNAAIDLLNVPFAERPGRIIAYAQQFPQFAEKINQVAYLPQGEQEAALRTVVAEAKMIDKLIQMERPSYQAIPEGGTLVNTRDPSAVQQFQGGAAQGGGSQYMEGQTAINPTTGQRIVFRNGNWRPM